MDQWNEILGLLAVLQAGDRELDPVELAAEAGQEVEELEVVLGELSASGLCLEFEDEGEPVVPFVTDAGHQWLGGYRPSRDALAFLPGFVDDLRAREALVAATRTLSGEFEAELAAGTGVEYVRQILPAGFASAVDAPLAVRLYGAMAAITARLGGERPAACVAEELMAVAIIAEATSTLEDDVALDRLSEQELRDAVDATRGIFELFEDDDVLMLFEMKEPGDAAVSGHGAKNAQLGVADHRVEAWFDAFGGQSKLGHLSG